MHILVIQSEYLGKTLSAIQAIYRQAHQPGRVILRRVHQRHAKCAAYPGQRRILLQRFLILVGCVRKVAFALHQLAGHLMQARGIRSKPSSRS